MSSKHQKGPDLKRFMDKRLKLSLNGNRKVTGQLRGYDAFLNVVLEDAVSESTTGGNSENIGTVVIRGNSIIQFESVDRISS
ncbi:hypothetical protein ACHAWC_001240 [Mediolabrus comicus]